MAVTAEQGIYAGTKVSVDGRLVVGSLLPETGRLLNGTVAITPAAKVEVITSGARW